jgi:hypothetical protein
MTDETNLNGFGPDDWKPRHPTSLDGSWDELAADPDLVESLETGPPSDPPDIRGLTNGRATKKMADWFLANFENPAESTPRDGGYVYIWGGPYNAREELDEAFGVVATERAIEAAVEQIENEGFEWAPALSRIQPEPCSALIAAKRRLMRILEDWRDQASRQKQLPPVAEFDVRDVAMLLHALHQPPAQQGDA